MKPAAFEYHAPEEIEAVLERLSTLGDEAKLLAGGQSLIPVLAMRLSRFEHLVDLGRVAALRDSEPRNGSLRIGAMVSQREIERDARIAQQVPLLARATPLIGHFQIRNRGTIGGSIAHADPAAEYPAVALALDARLEVAAPSGTRMIPAGEFFHSTFETALAADELLTAVHLPVRGPHSGFAVREVTRRLGDFALAGAACAVELDGKGRIARAAIALFGLDSRPVRVSSIEASLLGSAPGDVDFTSAGHDATAETSPQNDVHASGNYRKRVGAQLVAQVLREASEEALHAG